MSKDQVEAQKLRGVPGGVATYSLVDARPGEVSAVYDGAIPGAGFAKAFHRLNAPQRNPVFSDERDELLFLYPELSEDFLRGSTMAKNRTFKLSHFLGLVGGSGQPAHLREDGEEEDTVTIENDLQPARFSQERTAPARGEQAESPEVTQLRTQLAAERAERDKDRSNSFAAEMLAAKKITPSEQKPLASLMLTAMSDDRTNNLGVGLSREQLLREFVTSRTPHTLGKEEVVSDPSNPAVKEALAAATGKTTAVASEPPADKTLQQQAEEDADNTRKYAESRRKAVGAN